MIEAIITTISTPKIVHCIPEVKLDGKPPPLGRMDVISHVTRIEIVELVTKVPHDGSFALISLKVANEINRKK